MPKALETTARRCDRYRKEWDRELVPTIRRQIAALEQLQAEYRRAEYRRDSGAQREDQRGQAEVITERGHQALLELRATQGRMKKLWRYLREHSADTVPVVRREWAKPYTWA